MLLTKTFLCKLINTTIPHKETIMTPVGIFILGVLTAWLVEWLFFTFYLKGKTTTQPSIDGPQNLAIDNNSSPTVIEPKESQVVQEKSKIELTKETRVKTEAQGSEEETSRIDDLTKLKGIGPKLTEKLASLGITSFKQLSTIKEEDLLEKLDKAGARVVNKAILSNLSEQAALAAKEDWKALEELQKEV